jgi:hypothetical protein
LVESGWEFPALIHALRAGAPAAALRDRRAWREAAAALCAGAGVTAEALGAAVNRARDRWFARDPHDWLAHHTFYPGVLARVEALAGSPVHAVVVTTKAERFVRALLGARSAALGALPIVGREPGRPAPKAEILARLGAERGLAEGAGLWFVEDLLETLDLVRAAPTLPRARLFLATWGYNTLEDRAAAGLRPDVTPLSLPRFAGPFGAWR